MVKYFKSTWYRKLPLTSEIQFSVKKQVKANKLVTKNCKIQLLKQKVSSVTPVSYTHLDVYKRQVKCCPV